MRAIYGAALAELAEVGLGGLTIDGIARRSGAGRMSLYRRWSSPQALALDAMSAALPANVAAAPDTGDLRADLHALLVRLQAVLAGPLGPIMTAVWAERARYPEIAGALRDRLFRRRSQIREVLEQAARRGEIAEAAISTEACRAAPALMTVHYLVSGRPPSGADLDAILDRVVLPAVGWARPAVNTRRGARP